MRPDGIQRGRVHEAAHPGAGSQELDPRRADPESLQGLRTAWRRQSLSAGWLAEDDWWTAAVDAVARAACRYGSLRQACTMLGRARAEAGVGITEAMTDVAALYRVLGEGTPPLDADPRSRWSRSLTSLRSASPACGGRSGPASARRPA